MTRRNDEFAKKLAKQILDSNILGAASARASVLPSYGFVKSLQAKKRAVALTVLFAMLLAGYSNFAMAAVPQRMTISEIVKETLSHYPQFKETQEKVTQAEEQIPQTRASILPNLSLINSVTSKKDPSNSPRALFGGTSYNSYSVDLHLTQPLFVVGSISAIESVEKSRDLAKLDVAISRRDLTSSVTQAYFKMVLSMRNVDTLVRQEKIVRESLATAEQRNRTGRGQLLDVLQVKTQLALLASQIADAKDQVQVSAATLANYLGDAQPRDLTIFDSLESPPLSLIDVEVNHKEFYIPELEKNRVALLQVENQKRVALGSNLPYVSATADYIYSSYTQSDLFQDTSSNWAVGVTLTVPIFSGLSSIYQQRGLASQSTALQYDRAHLENQLNSNAIISRKQLETANASIITGKEALKLAIESSDEARRKYRLATIDFTQFLTVQQQYVQAEQSLNTYKFNYLVALIQYYVNAGQNMDRLIELLERNK